MPSLLSFVYDSLDQCFSRWVIIIFSMINVAKLSVAYIFRQLY